MDIEGEIVPSPPSSVHRETNIIPIDPVVPADPISLVDIPRDIVVGNKMHAWAQQTMQEAEGDASPQGTS
jgi:hypothetical protein